MYVPVDAWLRAFLLTVAVELPVAFWLLRGRDPAGPRLAAVIVFASLLTHPAVWFVFPQVFYLSTPEYLLAAETWAVVVEAAFYWTVVRGVGPGRALAVSLAANLASFVAGLAVTAVFPGAFY
jgi:hypothetical protein